MKGPSLGRRLLVITGYSAFFVFALVLFVFLTLPLDRAPRKDALPIGIEQARRREVAADGKQATDLGLGRGDRREGVEWSEKGDHPAFSAPIS